MSSIRDAVRVTCKRTRILLVFASVVVGAFYLYFMIRGLIDPSWFGDQTAKAFGERRIPLNSITGSFFYITIFLQGLLMMATLFVLSAAFKSIYQKENLSVSAGKHLRKAGMLVAAYLVISHLVQPLQSLVLVLSSLAGEWYAALDGEEILLFSFEFGATGFFTLILSFTLFMTGHLITRTAALEEESRQIV